jgi:hypothetical protein
LLSEELAPLLSRRAPADALTKLARELDVPADSLTDIRRPEVAYPWKRLAYTTVNAMLQAWAIAAKDAREPIDAWSAWKSSENYRLLERLTGLREVAERLLVESAARKAFGQGDLLARPQEYAVDGTTFRVSRAGDTILVAR